MQLRQINISLHIFLLRNLHGICPPSFVFEDFLLPLSLSFRSPPPKTRLIFATNPSSDPQLKQLPGAAAKSLYVRHLYSGAQRQIPPARFPMDCFFPTNPDRPQSMTFRPIALLLASLTLPLVHSARADKLAPGESFPIVIQLDFPSPQRNHRPRRNPSPSPQLVRAPRSPQLRPTRRRSSRCQPLRRFRTAAHQPL